jgi:hypothetical protein
MQVANASSHVYGRALAAALLLVLAASRATAVTDDGRYPGDLRNHNYLIVTASEYAGSVPLTQFVEAKEAQGFNVSVHSVPSGTHRSVIKDYILDVWGTEERPKYILLVGDTDGSTSTSTTIPHWTGGGSKAAPTDLPYACMDAGDDWHAEVAIGRFSVRSVSALQTVVDKSLQVEGGAYPDPDYPLRGAFLANPGTCGMAEPTHDWVIDNYFTPNGYEGIRIYSAEGGNTQDVTDAVNDGCLWVVYYGHSGSSGWWDPSFNQANVQALSNAGMYGVILSFSCNVGNYTLSECFGETWVRVANRGAAAVIFPSGYIYWGSVEAWRPSTVLEHSFYRAFFVDDIWQVGLAWRVALNHFENDYDGSEDVKRNFFELYNLLGDPSLCLPHTPSPMHVSPPNDLLSEGPQGGPFIPGSITYELNNNADYPIDYEVTHGSADWVTLSGDLSGTLPAGGTRQVIVQINSLAEDFGTGGYNDTVYFTNLTDNVGDTTRNVVLSVGVPELQYSWTFDSNPGWSTQGLWAFGQPTGGGGQYGGPDPTSGHTGPYVYGYNLYGDYENNLPERHLTTTAIDCSDLTRVSLRFWRWLGVEQPAYDHATVRISNDGDNWETLWSNASEVADYSWHLQEFDIAAVANNQPTVYLRWTMGPTDYSWQYCGNIDDVEIWAIQAAPCFGDLDGDDDIDVDDLSQLLAHYGMSGDATYEDGDLDGDLDVDLGDLSALLAVYGTSCP